MIFLCIYIYIYLPLSLYFIKTSIIVLASPDEGLLKPERFNIDFPL